MKVHMHTQFCLICLLTFVFHHCNHCHEHGPEENHEHNDYQISQAPYLQNGRTEPAPSKEAEDEQKYYIKELFDRYGENGKLSFFGLEKLLTNLGLGEVRVVEISHEGAGHNPVSHLDVIEVQEGKHTHSHSHPHSHNHSGSQNPTVNERPAKRSRKCELEKEAAESSSKPDGKRAHAHHNHRHHPHHHPHRHLDRNSTHHSHNDSVSASGHGEPSHEPSTETNTTQEQPEKSHKPKKKRGKGKKTNSDVPLDHDRDSNEQYDQNRVYKAPPSHAQFHERNNNGHASTHGQQDSNPASGDGVRHASKREASQKQISVTKLDVSPAHGHKDHSEDGHRHEEVSVWRPQTWLLQQARHQLRERFAKPLREWSPTRGSPDVQELFPSALTAGWG